MPAKRKAAGKTRSGKRSSKLTPREQKRNAGYQLLQRGLSKAAVAQILDVSWVTTNRWSKQLKTKQTRKLDRQRVGRPKKLSGKQLATLKRILKKGALRYGYPTELWTLKRVAKVIEQEFGVKYNTTHVWRVLKSLGFSAQIPLLKAMERNEKAIHDWISINWPQIVETAQKENAVIFFYDESCVQSQPNVRKTWAVRGKRPEIRVKQGSRDKLSIISAVTWDGELFFSVHGHNLTDKDTVRFLRRLIREVVGKKILVLWDGLIIHRSGRVKRFLLKNSEKVTARRFPTYAPELNPDEQVWNLAKHGDLANWCPVDKREMKRVINREMRKLKSEKTRVASAIRHAKIPLPPLQHF
jgi:transposase